MDLEVVLNTKYNNHETRQVIKGTEHDVSMLIMVLSKEDYYDESVNIEIEDVSITL